MNKFNIGSQVITETGDRGEIIGDGLVSDMAYVKLDSTGLTQKWHVDRLKPAPLVERFLTTHNPALSVERSEDPVRQHRAPYGVPKGEQPTDVYAVFADTIAAAETERLRNAVIEASRDYYTIKEIKYLYRLKDAVKALMDFEKPDTAPAPARCAPPDNADGTYWLANYEAGHVSLICALWGKYGGLWSFHGRADGLTPEDAHSQGWRYHSIARPADENTRKTQTQNLTPDQIIAHFESRNMLVKHTPSPFSAHEFGHQVRYTLTRDQLVHGVLSLMNGEKA